MKKLLSLCMCALLIVGVYGCGQKSMPAQQQATAEAGEVMSQNEQTQGVATDANQQVTTQVQENRKIIYEATLSLEALDFDKALGEIINKMQALDGYTVSSRIDGKKGESRRNAEYVFRIPQSKYNEFLTAIGEYSNVYSQEETAEDITSEYIDTEARMKSLKLQETRLLAMMEEAGELETLLAIQNQLSEVQYRIESTTSQKNAYDKLTQYATVNISLYEVAHITETQRDTFAKRIGAAIRESGINFSEGIQGLVISVIYMLPYLIVLAVIFIVVMFVMKKVKSDKIGKSKTNTE